MKKNYSNYSKQDYATPAVEAPIMEPLPEAEPEPNDTTTVEAAQLEVEKEEPKLEPKKGEVTCSLLNIRKLPSLNSEVITKLKQGAEVTIDPEYETVEWFKVLTASGQEGYCMRKFIDVK